MKRNYIVLIILLFIGTGFIVTQTDEYFEIMRSIELFGSTYREIVSNYVDDVSPKNLMKRGINGMLEALDPFSNFFDETEKGEIDLLTTGKYGGIGILIDSRGDELIVTEVMPGYAAQRQGIKVGDVIVAVDDEEVTPQNINRLTTKVRGLPGTEVKLKIRRVGEPKILEFHLIREEIKVQNISVADFIPGEDGIYYAKVDRFSKRVTEEFYEKIKEAKKENQIKAIVLDLRSNPGGLLQSAIELLEFFVPKGEMILFTKGRSDDSRQEFYSRATPQFGDIPLVVLIDENSASASEIVAGTIQDLDRGVIVGEKSFGKGLVQTVIPLPYDASLKLTTARYYTPSGRCIQKLDYFEKSKDVLKYKSDTAKIYFTKNKRRVYGDGGVTPDTIVNHKNEPEIVTELLKKGMFFKFISEKLASEKDFKIDQLNDTNILNEFVKFLEKSKFEYQPAAKKMLDDVIRLSEKNGIDKQLQNELKSLSQKFNFNLRNEVLSHDEIILIYLRGELANQMRNSKMQLNHLKNYDDDIKTALFILKNKKVYDKFLGL
ncbi:MAG: S41 family peptidase [Ignavibacteria bacterium]|nr:S41 family peptidase [Ignavibacteria bacterium]